MSWTVKGGTVALGPLSRQDPPRDLAVIERQHVGAHDLIGLVTLARDDDGVAGLGPAEHGAKRPGAAPARRTPTTISSMIASGRSERGLSEVTQTWSQRRAAISPMIGRF